MAGMEDAINNILNDPSSMEKISRMAADIFGGGEKKEERESFPDFDPKIMSRIAAMMSQGGSGAGNKTALLEALAPFLAESRRQKLEKAARLARMAKIAGSVFGEAGGGGLV